MNPTSQQQENQQVQPPAPAMTADMIAAIVRGAMPQQQQMQQAPMSEQELHKMLKRFDANEDIVTQMFAPEATPQQRMACLNQIIRGAVTEAVTTSRYGTEYMVEQLLGHLDEPLSFARDYGQERLFEQLYKGHDGLKMFDGVVRQLVTPLSQDPTFPKGLSERATWLRDRITGEIKKSIPTFDSTKPLIEQGQPQGAQGGQQQPPNGSGAWGHNQHQTNQHQSPPAVSQSPAQTRPGFAPAGGSQGHGGDAGNGATSGGTQPGPGAPTADKPFGF